MARSENNLVAVFTDTANAIRSKTGGTSAICPRDFADEIDAIPTGGGAPIDTNGKNVIVYDYDGTVLDAQTIAAGGTYTLPEGPTHDGLTFDGWSCTAAIVNNTVTIPETEQVRIGAMYHTTSGKIEYVVVPSKNIPVKIVSGYAGQTIDWGDGTIDTSTSHTYAQEGEYTIKITPKEAYTTDSCRLDSNFKYIIKEIRLPNTVTLIANSGYRYCYNLKNIAFPNTVTQIGNYTFNNCYSLKHVNLPSQVNFSSTGSYAFSNCHSLERIFFPYSVSKLISNLCESDYNLKEAILPDKSIIFEGMVFNSDYSLKTINCDKVTTLGSSALTNCYCFEKITLAGNIPSNCCQNMYGLRECNLLKTVGEINSQGLGNCVNCGVFDFSHHESVPTMTNTNAFQSINANAKIIVPDALYETWIAASNWSNYASQIVKASEA